MTTSNQRLQFVKVYISFYLDRPRVSIDTGNFVKKGIIQRTDRRSYFIAFLSNSCIIYSNGGGRYGNTALVCPFTATEGANP